MPDLKRLSGLCYLQETKLTPERLRERRPLIEACPVFKEYSDTERVALPRPAGEGLERPLRQVLQDRRSHRKFSASPLTLPDLAQLLWASQGITARAGNYFFRTAPSAGALYPIETYLGINNVTDVQPGLYHFSPHRFDLEQLNTGPPGAHLARAALGQKFLADSGVVFIWSAVFRRNMCKYGNRGLRYILLDAGHICENLLLAAEALGLGACPVAAFFDDEMNDLLGIDGEEESVLYLAAVGHRS
ncbi:MAG: SagB/ThcOx family dehydrogenase [Desulfobulbaceae bacterium]